MPTSWTNHRSQDEAPRPAHLCSAVPFVQPREPRVNPRVRAGAEGSVSEAPGQWRVSATTQRTCLIHTRGSSKQNRFSHVRIREVLKIAPSWPRTREQECASKLLRCQTYNLPDTQRTQCLLAPTVHPKKVENACPIANTRGTSQGQRKSIFLWGLSVDHGWADRNTGNVVSHLPFPACLSAPDLCCVP